MPWKRGRREKDSKDSDKTEQRPSLPRTQGAHPSEQRAGACGTTADEMPDGNLRNFGRAHRGWNRSKPWESKNEGPSSGKGANQEMIKAQRPRRVTPVRRDQKLRAQHYIRGKFPGQFHSLELKPLKDMDYTEVVSVLNENMAHLKYFLISEEDEHNSAEFIMDLTCVLANACSAPPSEKTNKILSSLKGSVFLSSKIPRFLDHIQGSTTLQDQESRKRLIQWLIAVFVKYLRHLPSSYADLPYDQLKQALEQSNIDGKDELQNDLQAFKRARDDIIRAERQKHGKRYINKAGQKPPNDFRDIPVCPTGKEIRTQERPFLRKNITKGRYDDAEHYLDVQFRLLREDFLEPLREGIPEIVQNVPKRQRKQLMRYYPGARIVGKTLTPSGITYKVQFDTSRFDTSKWARSKRLIFGSFLCLSKDNFETMLFATVCNRDPNELIIGKIDICFIEEQDVFGIENQKCQYQMIESPAYYEAYHHVLRGLKELDEATLPFKKYLVECSEVVDPPEYLKREDTEEPVCYDLSRALDAPRAANVYAVPVLKPEAWPSVDLLPLNNSQLEALKTALTTEFSVIQGPPGTGKTYVGARIVRCLLENRKAWHPGRTSPMLMVCYTNHALDQFLEKVLEFLPKEKIIRVGGRCQSQQLLECNLKLFTRKYRMNERRNEIEETRNGKSRETFRLRDLLAKADTVLLGFDDLEELLNAEHTEQLYSASFPHSAASECRTPSNTFKLWLCSNKQMNSCNQKSKIDHSQGENSTAISVSQDNEREKDDNAPYEARFLSTLDTNERNRNNHLASEKGPWEAIPKDTPSSDPFSDADESQVPKTYLNAKKDLKSAQEDLTKTPHDETVPKGLSSQHKSELAGSGAFPLSHNLEQMPAPDAHEKSVEEEIPHIENSQILTEIKNNNKEHDNKEHFEEITDAREETITVENEADLIYHQRFIHGDEDFLPVISKRADDERILREDVEIIRDQEEEWELVSYRKKGTIFPWKQITVKHTEDKIGDTDLSTTLNADDTTQAKPSKKKNKKKKKKNQKIVIKADVRSITDLVKVSAMSSDEAIGVENIWLLSPSDRLRLYLFWVESYRERYSVEINRCEQEYEQICQQLEAVRFEEEEEVIRRATVVGMTTSCAARYHTVLQRVAPKIVVIEEAAEVMEAHIITSLSHNTKHTILIGDHKQLRPKATVYELAQKYNLEISLFERMVMNSMDCKRLSIQHRMRPEIAELTKRIYDHEIVDHESVCEFEDIAGVACNLFFIDHCEFEKPEAGLQSYSNLHEARFIVALCHYLLLHGYQPSQITILTMYTGQLLLLQEFMPRKTFGGVRVCVVDNFQGEENDIILLSLVRSNSDGKIGFLGDSNRICVALSRARKGFYCIGNFSLLKSHCKLWKEICDHLQKKNAISKSLSIVCKGHKNETNVFCASDFDIYGGCRMPCVYRLKCGHACDIPCHASDLHHEISPCKKICLISCPNEHQCQERCHHPRKCFKCRIIMLKTIPRCGHQQNVLCYIDAEEFSCQARCERILLCGHNCQELCGNKCTRHCMIRCMKTLPCDHEKLMPCSEDPIRYSHCETIVTKSLPCGHQKDLPCSQDPKTAFCLVSCERRLDCGHRCSSVCAQPCQEVRCQELCLKKCEKGHVCHKRCHLGNSCGNCFELVNETIPGCGHNIEIPCHLDPASIKCKRRCEKLRACGHPCLNTCSAECENQPCKKRVEVILSCGHKTSLLCYVAMGGKENVLCNEIVERELRCKHKKELPCHKNPDEYVCKEKVKAELSCGHVKSLICYIATGKLQDVSCMVKIERKLPCEHNAKLPCHIKPEEYVCEKEVEITLSCSHKKQVTCAKAINESQNELCDTVVTRKLSCGHNKKMKCSDQPKEAFCDAACGRLLPCKHPCPGKCGEDCSSFKCAVTVQKPLHCGFHEINCPCAYDVSQDVCTGECTRNLTCGHKCPGKCSEDCSRHKCQKKILKPLHCAGSHSKKMACSGNPKSVKCQKQCTKTLDCGHPCPGLCNQDCGSLQCMRKVEKRFPCNHKETINCHESKTATCTAPCPRRKSPCNHICQGVCGQDCSTFPCEVAVVKALSCGHRVKMSCSQSTADLDCPAPCKEDLPCGHQCTGTCSECLQRSSHEMCLHPCGRLLVCSHRCKAKCGVPCPPCDRKCGRRCPHTTCKSRCSQLCMPCNKPCTWMCPHHQCNSLCWEECERPRCDAPCPKKLSCSHPCIGLCGENCPTVCPICHPKKLTALLAGGSSNKTESARYLQLWDCNHIVEVKEMDAWIQNHLGNDIQVIRCPKCTVVITFSYRYGRIIKKTLADVESVKRQIGVVEAEVDESTRQLKKDITQVIPWKWNPSTLRGKPECLVSLKFIFRNHLMILEQVQHTQRVLKVRRRKERMQGQEEKKEEKGDLPKSIEDALGEIKEYLEKPQLDLKTLSQVHLQTRKFFLFSHVLEAQSEAKLSQIPLSDMGRTRLKFTCDRFALFLQGEDHALDTEWLEKIVNALRTELNLPSLKIEEPPDFANFPGYQRDVWNMCTQGHVYYKTWIVRGGQDILVGGKGCTKCGEVHHEDS